VRISWPRALLIASVVLAAATVALGLAIRPRPGPPYTPPAGTPPKTLQTRPSAGPSSILAPTVSAAAYDATLSWSTSASATGSVRWGPAGMTPLLWSNLQPSSTDQSVELSGLAAATRYTATIEAVPDDGPTAVATVTFTTAQAPDAPRGEVAGGILRVDEAPLFPIVTWHECPDRWRPDIADGIDLFGGNPCTGLQNLLAAVQGRALVAGTTDDASDATGPGLVGWFYPDEADARGYTGDTLPTTGAGVRFLTLTAHFAAMAAPLPQGRSMYPGLISRADVVGFDLYPLQELCRPELLSAVFDTQAQLVRLAWPRPTFQWIEEREMKCPQPDAAVTPATIRVESWLAIAAGAHGLAFFPPDWHAPTGPAIRGITRRIRQLEPALLQPTIPVTVTGSPDVRAAARTLHGAVYLIAVNPATSPATVELAADALGDRRYADGLHTSRGKATLTLPSRSVRIAVSPPVR
jgi:hypothetical protein